MIDRGHLTAGSPYEHVLKRLCVETELRSGLKHHSVELRESVHVRSIASSHISCKYIKHITGRGSVSLALRSIHFHKIHRIFGVERCLCTTHFRSLVELYDEVICDPVKILKLAALLVLYIDLETGAGSIARNHTSGVDHDVGRSDVGSPCVHFLNYRVNVVFFAGSFIPVLQSDHEVTRRRTLAEHHSPSGGS